MIARLIALFLCPLTLFLLHGCQSSGGQDNQLSVLQAEPDIVPGETADVPQAEPDITLGEMGNAPPKINVYSVYEAIEAEGYVIKFDILSTIIVDETSVAPVIESILLEKIFKREIEVSQFGPISPLNGVDYEDGVLTIDYSTVGSKYLDRGSHASYFIRREIERTVFSCSLINTLDERMNGESDTFVNHYSFFRTERDGEFDAFIYEEASLHNASIILVDKNYEVFSPLPVPVETPH